MCWRTVGQWYGASQFCLMVGQSTRSIHLISASCNGYWFTIESPLFHLPITNHSPLINQYNSYWWTNGPSSTTNLPSINQEAIANEPIATIIIAMIMISLLRTNGDITTWWWTDPWSRTPRHYPGAKQPCSCTVSGNFCPAPLAFRSPSGHGGHGWNGWYNQWVVQPWLKWVVQSSGYSKHWWFNHGGTIIRKLELKQEMVNDLGPGHTW